MTTPYDRCSGFSERKIEKLRLNLGHLPLDDRIVLLCGSFARREAAERSDVDFSMISEQEDNSSDLLNQVRNAISEIVPHGPSSDGVFGKEATREKILRDIGGQNDNNANITHRVLILLEGDWLFNLGPSRAFCSQG